MRGHNRAAIADRPIEIAVGLLLKERNGQIRWRNELDRYGTHPLCISTMAERAVDFEQTPSVLDGLPGSRYRIGVELAHLFARHRTLPLLPWDCPRGRAPGRLLRLDRGLVLHVSAPREAVGQSEPDRRDDSRQQTDQ